MTLVSNCIRTPRARANADERHRARRARGSTAETTCPSPASSASGMPRSSLEERALLVRAATTAACRASGAPATSVTNRSGSSTEGRTLQRPPPLIRILRPPSAVRSISSDIGVVRRRKIAATRPAAPAPITRDRSDSHSAISAKARSGQVPAGLPIGTGSSIVTMRDRAEVQRANRPPR